MDTTNADLIVIFASQYSGVGPFTPTDSKSNAWTALPMGNCSIFGQQEFDIFYTSSAISGTSHAFTFGGSTGFVNIAVQAWKNSIPNPFDQQSTAVINSGGTLATGSVTPSLANELVVTGDGTLAASQAPTVDSGFTVTDSTGGVGGTSFGVGAAYIIQTAATAVNPTWTNNSQPICVGIATFEGVSTSAAAKSVMSISGGKVSLQGVKVTVQ